MNQTYIPAFLMAFTITFLATPLMRRLAFKIGAIDRPGKRKVHAQPLPRAGGLAIALGILVPFLAFFELDRQLAALLAGFLLMLVVGTVDDIKRLRARYKLIWQILAALVVLAGGIGIVYVTNPFGGIINLDAWRIPMSLWGFEFNILPLANLVSVIWIVAMINAVNLLDGLDGLAAGVAAIAAAVLFVMAITTSPNIVVGLLSIILLGAILGFLPYNFYPSSIFMGDSGAYSIGLMLAVLSIYAGSKIAVGALVMGFAFADMVWAVLRRLARRSSPFKSDRGHFHHRLVDSGLFSHRRAVLSMYAMTIGVAVAIFIAGGTAAFVVLILVLIGVAGMLRVLGPIRTRRL